MERRVGVDVDSHAFERFLHAGRRNQFGLDQKHRWNEQRVDDSIVPCTVGRAQLFKLHHAVFTPGSIVRLLNTVCIHFVPRGQAHVIERLLHRLEH